MLHAENLQSGYGAAQVLFGVNLDIQAHQVVSLLGRNGMGKTTTVRTLMGMLPLKGGSITFDGQPVGGQRPHRIAKLGFGLVPEGRRVFPSLSVYENLVATSRNDYGGSWTLDAVYELFPRLKERSTQSARTLSGGEQQMLAIGRALIGNPRVLLLDEPFEGLAPVIVDVLVDAFGKLRASGELAIVLVEQHAELALELTDRAVVLDRGRVVWHGASASLGSDAERLASLIGLEEV